MELNQETLDKLNQLDQSKIPREEDGSYVDGPEFNKLCDDAFDIFIKFASEQSGIPECAFRGDKK